MTDIIQVGSLQSHRFLYKQQENKESGWGGGGAAAMIEAVKDRKARRCYAADFGGKEGARS